MDVESDESERWEDFFGSSTDLTPSLISFYDNLTCNSFNGDSENTEDDEKRRTGVTDSDSIIVEEEVDVITTTVTASKVQTVGHTVSNGLTSKHCNFRILSPNVQRLISNSNSAVDRIENGLVQYHNLNNSCLTKAGKRVITKQKLSHIPLSRNTCKLTQAGNELVETFDSNSLSSNESLDSLHTPTNQSLQLANGIDNDKTPTNSHPDQFRFDSSVPHEINDHRVSDNRLDSKSDYANNPQVDQLGETIRQEAGDIHRNEANRITEIVKRFHQMYTSTLAEKDENLKDTMGSILENNIREIRGTNGKTAFETYNFLVRKPNPTKNHDSENGNAKSEVKTAAPQRKLSPPSSPLLTYSRTKKLASGKPASHFQKSHQRKNSSSSLENSDTVSELKVQPGSPNIGNRPPSHILLDMAKFKHRPLSSSSICSTSSNSSSGSEHHPNGKLTVSYLASVESLADHSEGELMGGGSTSLTVFKRACMEFVDSERSYVKDLSQVIDGYLTRWKKDASLKEDELKILFSNIQDIHSFNSDLLERLIDAEMDPIKIAKCFNDLKDGFIVYTTYCTSYPEAIGFLTSLFKATHTNTLLTLTQKSLKHTLPLGSYLLKPVQRIMKYHLLLDNLRKHCDIEEVVQAHAIMREVAWNIDQVKKKLEQKSRVKELYNVLDGWLGPDLTVLGELKQEGILMENNKPRHVFLFQTMLIITKPKEDDRLQYKSYIYRNNLMLREHLPCEPTSFNVIPYDDPRNQIKLTAKNRDQKREWTQNIKDVMLEQFDIPSRAKELVYKLGDEEDRTPDKNIWKWGSNSTTPVYLERRNQYRRSEMRNRSKMKRKTISNSTSLEGFSTKKDSENGFVRKQSMDDNMMPSLSKVSDNSFAGAKSKPGRCNHNKAVCRCSLIRQEFENMTEANSMKERCKSVPRIPGTGESDDDYHLSTENIPKKSNDSQNMYKFSTLGRAKSTKLTEVKVYTTKTIPKRIATLKKNKARKETSKFYMDLNDFDDTILKITESSENLPQGQEHEVNEKLESENMKRSETPKPIEEEKSERAQIEDKLKKDAEIISELLKASMNRVSRKPPKKRSLENGISVSSTDLGVDDEADNTPPPLPSNSPPPLELEDTVHNNGTGISDHIYESLRRNVHVPYKFSPVLNRSKSQQYYTSCSLTEKKGRSLPARPESDYVTLVYSESGNLQGVGEASPHITSAVETLRNSDSNINYESIVKCDSSSPAPGQCFSSVGDLQAHEAIACKASKNLLQRFISAKGEHHVSTSESSLLPRPSKAVETAGLGRGNKPPERRVSDVTEMCRQSIIHRQGSHAVGERMANSDYVDPRTLFSGSMNNSAVSLDPQRDSVFSLTSSSDSVGENKKNSPIIEENSNGTYFTYEENVEACLENDFRDSAVYSDDNDRRQDYEHSEYCDYPGSPPPLPKKQSKEASNNKMSSSKIGAPPPIPAKPNFILSKRPDSGTSTGSKSPEVPSPSGSEGKSWVLKQIENFNK